MAGSQDAPDWLALPAGTRYIGAITCTGPDENQALPVDLTAYDAAIVAVPRRIGGAATSWLVQIYHPPFVNTTATADYGPLVGTDQLPWPLVGFVNAAINPQWEVSSFLTGGSPGGEYVLDVFALPQSAVQLNASGGAPVNVQGGTGLRPIQADVTDDPARQLGIVSTTGTGSTDVSDRAARQLGIVSGSGTFTTDPTDRAARQLGIVSVTGNPADNVAQWGGTAVNAPLSPGDLLANASLNGPAMVAAAEVWDNVNSLWRRVRNMDSGADGNPADSNGNLQAMAKLNGFDGTTWSRLRMSGTTFQLLVAHNKAGQLIVEGKSAANTAQTLTLAAPGSGLRIFVTHVRIARVATAALAGTAALDYTTTNLAGIRWTVGNAMAAGGTQVDVDQEFDTPLRAVNSNAPVTIVLPACGAAVLTQAWVAYYIDS